jgi:hypothetical protein
VQPDSLIGAELLLIITIPGQNYGGADGKAAQAEILATLEFARPFDIRAAAVTAVSLSVYTAAYSYLEGDWWLPLPIYIEHALFALFWTAAIAGYWGWLEALVSHVSQWMHEANPWRARLPLLSSRQAAAAAPITELVPPMDQQR